MTAHGSTAVTFPWERVKPPGWFIHELADTTDSVPSTPATTMGTPVQKCAHRGSRSQP